MDLKMNSFSWNPMEPFIFTAASEDYNVYTYDTRYFKFPRRIYRGHTNAVLDVDYSPSGREFVTGSYDSTVSWTFFRMHTKLIGTGLTPWIGVGTLIQPRSCLRFVMPTFLTAVREMSVIFV